jgi:hypothetical protein
VYQALLPLTYPHVIAGLDPAIHQPETTNSFSMDARVKPAHDERESIAAGT